MELTIPSRFCGPPESGNGGWVAGAVARTVPTVPGRPAVSVRLSSPPPLERRLALSSTIERHDGAHEPSVTVRLLDRGHVVATAAPAPDLDDHLPAPVGLPEARAAEERYEGAADHPFPTCFSCGTARVPGDGLCLRPGPLDDGTGRYATTWTPDEVDVPLVWAALDCPGGWSAGLAGRPMVLGTMTARVLALPVTGEPHVVLSWQRGAHGRRHLSGSALLTSDGAVLARAEATWVTVDPASVRPKEIA